MTAYNFTFPRLAAFSYDESTVGLIFDWNSAYELEFEVLDVGSYRDCTSIGKYSISPVAGSVGDDDCAASPVAITRVDVVRAPLVDAIALANLPSHFLLKTQFGPLILLYLDRPMSPFPSQYSVTATALFLSENVFGPPDEYYCDPITTTFFSTHGILAKASEEGEITGVDFANPQVPSATAGLPLPYPGAPGLGTFRVDATGDYAIDDGMTAFRKRMYRMAMTKKGSIAHLPGWGVGLPSYGKKLASVETRQTIAAEFDAQLSADPYVLKARTVVVSVSPGLYRVQAIVQTKAGTHAKVETPLISIG